MTRPYTLRLSPAPSHDQSWVRMFRSEAQDKSDIICLDDCSKQSLPFEDNEFEKIEGGNVLMHLHNPLPALEEFHRIAQHNALLTLNVDYGASDSAYTDPGGRRPYFIDSFQSFSQPFYARQNSTYKADWQPRIVVLAVNRERFQSKTDRQVLADLHQLRNIVLKMVVILSAVKPARPRDKQLIERPQIQINRL